jgi:large subunit ribosomal protein L25
VHLLGESAGVTEGGVLSQVTREVNVEALPMEIPEHLELDVSGLGINDTIRLADLHVPEGVTLLDDPDMVLATITVPTEIVEEEVLEVAEGELAEGEQPPEGGAESPAEPGAPAAGGEGTAPG